MFGDGFGCEGDGLASLALAALAGDAAEAAKKELVSALMAKCNMSEDQVLAAYDVFYAKYPGGEITQVCCLC